MSCYPTTAPIVLRQAPTAVCVRLSRHVILLLVICWLLSETSFSLPGRSAVLELSGLDALAVIKLLVRIASLAALSWVLLLEHMSARGSAVLRRCLPLLVFAAWTIATSLWSPIRAITVSHAVEALMLALLSIVTGIACRTGHDLEVILCNVVLMASVLLFGVLVMNADLIAHGARLSNYMQPNNAAGIAGCSLITLLVSRMFWRWRWTDKLLWPAGLILGTALFAAQSRSVLIVTSLVVLPLLWSMRAGNLAVVAAAAAGFLALAWPYSQTISHLPQSIESYLMRGQQIEDALTVSGRTELWDIAIPSFLEAPLFGHGYFSMTNTGRMFVWGAERWQTAHNVYLHVLTGTGLMGFFLLAWALFSVLTPLSNNLRKRGPTRKFALLVFLLVAWYLTLGFFELSFAGPVDSEVVLFFVLGIAAGQTASEQTCTVKW